MQVEYFDIEQHDSQEIALPWPLKILKLTPVLQRIRIHYILLPDATEQTATFYCVRSNQELPDTFPGKYAGTVDIPPVRTSETGDTPLDSDDSVHLFVATPVNRGGGPRVVKTSGADNGHD